MYKWQMSKVHIYKIPISLLFSSSIMFGPVGFVHVWIINRLFGILGETWINKQASLWWKCFPAFVWLLGRQLYLRLSPNNAKSSGTAGSDNTQTHNGRAINWMCLFLLNQYAQSPYALLATQLSVFPESSAELHHLVLCLKTHALKGVASCCELQKQHNSYTHYSTYYVLAWGAVFCLSVS